MPHAVDISFHFFRIRNFGNSSENLKMDTFQSNIIFYTIKRKLFIHFNTFRWAIGCLNKSLMSLLNYSHDIIISVISELIVVYDSFAIEYCDFTALYMNFLVCSIHRSIYWQQHVCSCETFLIINTSVHRFIFFVILFDVMKIMKLLTNINLTVLTWWLQIQIWVQKNVKHGTNNWQTVATYTTLLSDTM